MRKAFRKSLKRQASLGYFSNSRNNNNNSSLRSTSGTPILWRSLANKYQFNYPRDWYRIEAHWLEQIESFQEQPIDCPGKDGKMNNAITRISQCNESYQLCNSLPRSFIVPKDLKDFTLMNNMSTVIKDHRVPVISYCCPIEYRRNFIIRCASSDQQTKVIETLSRVVKPLKVLDLSSSTPNQESIESAHMKICDVCRPDEEKPSNFMSRSGKWLTIISQALRIAKETAGSLLTEASVILIEDEDRGWNNVICSLVQVMLEPHCRTVAGFEALISKEWIYLAGGHPDECKSDVFFILFLNCAYQIYLQNPRRFEFTSEYLRYLFEAQSSNTSHISEEIYHNKNYLNVNNNNNRSQRSNGFISKSKTTSYTYDEDEEIVGSEPASYKPSSMSMIDMSSSLDCKLKAINKVGAASVDTLESGYKIFMFNPFYQPNKDSPIVNVYDHVANIKLWSSLYLRDHPRITYDCPEETIYFQMYSPES